MNELTWHVKRASTVLNDWYKQADIFLDLYSEWPTLPFCKSEAYKCKSEAYKCKRDALKCKTLGLIYHDRYKLLLDGCWRKYD